MISTSRPSAGVMLVAIDGPRRRNALDLDAFRDLAAAWAELEQSASIRVAVVTGNGTDFSSGADLSSIGPGIAQAVCSGRSAADVWRDIHRAVLRKSESTKPVISAVEGICFGAGMELAGATDIRIAGRSARFALPEVRHGMVASGGSLARLARQVPYAAAMEILLTGSEFGAGRMAELGFVNELTDDGGAVDRALAIAKTLAQNAPTAVRATKRAVTTGLAGDLTGAYAIEDQVSREVLTGPEAQEGARAFAERRPPSWRVD